MNTTTDTVTPVPTNKQVQISKKSLTEDINNSFTQTQLMEKYSLSAGTLRDILKEAGLKIKKTKVKRFILVDDTNNTSEQTIN